MYAAVRHLRRWSVMPHLVLEPRDPCQLCGCRLRAFMMGTYRVNKHSMRADNGTLAWLECPECGLPHSRRNPLGVSQRVDRWRLDAKSQTLVDEYRARKGWS